MPKSKRNKQVELSKTRKHGMEGKKQLYSMIRSCVDEYEHLYIFSVADMRNAKMKNVREQWKDSRFFIGKNKVMALALGRSEEEEYRDGLHKIGERLKGTKCLLFSNRSPEDVVQWFSAHTEGDYARSGNVATQDVHLSEGPLPQFPHSIESYLRQLGLPTTLQKGVVHLVKDHEVCKEGDTLTPETARILKLLGYEMAEFQIKIECYWSKDGSFQILLPDSDDFNTKENRKSDSKRTPTKRKLSNAMDMDEPESMDITEETVENTKELLSEPKNKKKRVEDDSDSATPDQNNENAEISSQEAEDDENVEIPSEDVEDQENVEILSQEAEEIEVPDKQSLLKLTEKKLEDSGKKPTKYSPKMTRSRAAAAKQNSTSVTTEVKERKTRSRKAK